MITSIKDKTVNITWKENQLVQTFNVLDVDIMNDWVCLESQNENERGAIFWARFEDMDVIQVSTKDYNPLAAENPLAGMGGIPIGGSPDVPGGDQGSSSFIRTSMEFLLPQASAEFYMASHSQDAFAVIYKLMEMIDNFENESKKRKTLKTSETIEKMKTEAHRILQEYHVNFDEDEEDGNINSKVES